MKLRKWVKVTLGIIAISAVGISIFDISYRNSYKNQFYPKTYVSGKDISNLSISDTEKLLKKRYEAEKVTLRVNGKAIARTNIARLGTYSPEKRLKKALEKQKDYSLMKAAFKKKVLNDSDLTYDKKKINKWIKSIKILNDKSDRPKDAYVKLDTDVSRYTIVKEHNGSIYYCGKIEDYVYSSLKSGKTDIDLDSDKFIKKPKFTLKNGDLKKKVSALNKYADHTITIYDSSGNTVTLRPERYMKYLSYKDGEVSVDRSWLRSYARSLQYNFSSEGGAITFKTPEGQTIHTTSGTYRKAVSTLAERRQIEKDILSAKNVRRKVNMTTTGDDTLGKSFILINTGSQTITAWKNGKKIVSDRVVTGDVANSNGTTKGAYYIFSKESPKVLKAYDKETGKQLYASPVTYWMPFHNGQGIHDATWRSNWSKSAYLVGGGSHGCTNCKIGTARTIFTHFGVGTPVVVI